jgi:hypothetical protein
VRMESMEHIMLDDVRQCVSLIETQSCAAGHGVLLIASKLCPSSMY